MSVEQGDGTPEFATGGVKRFLVRLVTPMVAGIVALAVLGLVLGGRLGSSAADGLAGPIGNGRPCGDPVQVQVLATKDVAPVVRSVGDGLTAGGTCARYEVSDARPDQVLERLGGLGARPDVWIPDSSLWVQQAVKEHPDIGLTPSQPVATSPVVVGLSESLGSSVPEGKVPWMSLFGEPTFNLRLADPDTSSTGRLALLALREAAGADDEKTRLTVGPMLMRVASTVVKDTNAIPAAGAAGEATSYVVSEQQLAAYQRAGSGPKLIPGVPAPASMALDYPVVTAPNEDNRINDAVGDLQEALSGDAGRARLAAAGFRLGDGSGGPSDVEGMPLAVETKPLPDSGTVVRALRQWQGMSSDLRLLTIIDTSGSMDKPAGPNVTRMQLATAAAMRGLAALPATTDLGLWEFSTAADKKGPYRELAPVRRSDPAHKAKVQAALLTLKDRTGGDTPLYDSILAAVAELRGNYDPAKIHAIVVMTDGRNEATTGLTLEQLLTSLRMASSEGKNVFVVTVAMGPEADTAALEKIALATDGEAYVARNPNDIGKVLFDALMQFAG